MAVTIGRRSLFMGTIAALVAGTFSGTAAAAGGSSGPRVTFAAQGKLGEIVVNPYKIAPLTAIIKNGGYELTEATVRIVPKKDGQEIKYKVVASSFSPTPAFLFSAFMPTTTTRLR